MTDYSSTAYQMRWGIVFSLLTLLYGFSMGIAFGGFENELKGHLKTEAASVLQSQYNGDETQMKRITDKSWVYFKRAHLHANGLGTTALALIVLMSCLSISAMTRSLTALALGVGSLGYSVFWMLAGLSAPGMGSTKLAKEALFWLAVPTVALCTIGLLTVLLLTVTTLFLGKREE